MNRCLGCYQNLAESEMLLEYHRSCSQKLFDKKQPPVIDFGSAELDELAKKSISQHLGVTGVQPKISLAVDKRANDPNHRLMIVNLWGNYILKPSPARFPALAVVEDLTMHLAQLAGIKTATHGLIRLKSGELAYVTKRFDRPRPGQKRAVEDFCQLSELLTESKYKTSTEKAGKVVLKYSTQSGLDVIDFFYLQLFCFVTGNADMHLKNFSIMRDDRGEYVLAPAYDLVSTALLMPEDKEEMALTVNGKKSHLKRRDFLKLGETLKIQEKVIESSFNRILKHVDRMIKFVDDSFLSSELKQQYQVLVKQRALVLAADGRIADA